MARRPSLIQKTKKTVRVSKSEQYLVNRKYLGDEPSLRNNPTNLELIVAFNWYNSMLTTKEAREYLRDYLSKENQKLLRSVADVHLPLTACWMARLIQRGDNVGTENIQFLERKIQECLAKANPTEEKEEKPVISIQSRMREKTMDIIGDIEQMIDSGEPFSMYEWLQKNSIPPAYCTSIIEHYAPWLDELCTAYGGQDSDLKEAYKGWTKKRLADRVLMFTAMIDDLERYQSNQKKVRAVRKPKPVPVEKKIRNLKFQKESNELKIVSVNPEKIIGAQELWTYNTKTKVLTVFRALDRGGLQVKGTSIIGFSDQSMSKSVGRKPEQVLQKVLTGGKIVLRKIMDELKTDKKLQERINEHTVLLKVV